MTYDVDTVFNALLVLVGASIVIANSITAIDRAVDIIKKRNPNTELNSRIEKHEKRLDRDFKKLQEHDEAITKINKEIEKNNDINHTILRCLFVLLDGISGDIDKDGIKKEKEKLRGDIIDNGI